ncbi:type II toxin-antitoxin system RelE/ParE family toxin [Castellaniella sp.]|uniref:type II toxin-antitoxin system RelE/ParE family toxin n=1 Tax=Castellaniella sp. TaxID=1955812 RepID=UPI002AFE3121|nr:type II toxin-antitoxin system RelE/ParE family toxin [Castellaniella sp.]
MSDYITLAGSPAAAIRHADGIVSYCESLTTFPLRGTTRDDVMPGLRTTNYRHSTVIAFTVDVSAQTVSILGVFYGGQDFEAALTDPAKE